jgi:DNA repair protein RadC
MSYPIPKEHFMLGEIDSETRSARRVCASTRSPFSWLRFDICMPPRKKGKEPPQIKTSKEVSHFLHEVIPFAGRGQEYMFVLCLDTHNVPVAVANPHIGGRNAAEVDPVSVFRPAVLSNAVSVIVAHNHPSGNNTPSSADDAVTGRLKSAAEFLKLSVLDHVVLTDDPDKYYSYADHGRMPK